MTKLPFASSTRTTGCLENAAPAVAVAEGCVCSVNRTGVLVTGMVELVLEVFDGFVTSLAVSVALPSVFSLTLNVAVPPTNGAFPGKVAPLSEVAIRTTSVALLTWL